MPASDLDIECVISLTMDAVEEVGMSADLVKEFVKEAHKRICNGGHLGQRDRWFPFLNDVINEHYSRER